MASATIVVYEILTTAGILPGTLQLRLKSIVQLEEGLNLKKKVENLKELLEFG